MIKIGNRQLIFSEVLLCPHSEVIELNISVPNEDEPWPMRLAFYEANESDSDEDKKARMHLDDDHDGVAIATFHNWKNSLGSNLVRPARIATSDGGRPITMLAEVAKLTSLYRVTIQIMIEGDGNG